MSFCPNALGSGLKPMVSIVDMKAALVIALAKLPMKTRTQLRQSDFVSKLERLSRRASVSTPVKKVKTQQTKRGELDWE
ncbi:MAG: hypothetical protein AAGG57_03270 [Pseudomonadota bacterium]